MSKVLRQRSIYLRETFSNHIPGREGSGWRKGLGTLQKSSLFYSSFISAKRSSREKSQVCKCRFSTLPLHFTTETLRNAAWEREGPTGRQCLGERGPLPRLGSLRGPGALSDQLQSGAPDPFLETAASVAVIKVPLWGLLGPEIFLLLKKKKKSEAALD